MHTLDSLKGMEGFLNAVLSFLNVLIGIARFFFFTPWGWIIIIGLMILVIGFHAKNRKGETTVGGLVSAVAEVFFWLYTNLTNILIGIAILAVLSFVNTTIRNAAESVSMLKEIKVLEGTLKNLRAERKLAEVRAEAYQQEDGQALITAKITYYAYSMVRNAEVATGERTYNISGHKLYVDFGVINFDYALIEKGTAVNLAFPGRIFSDTLSYQNGVSVCGETNGVPLTYRLDEKDFYVLSQDDYDGKIREIFDAVTNSSKARKMGIRTSYGESVGFVPQAGKTYTFYSTGSGGVIVR